MRKRSSNPGRCTFQAGNECPRTSTNSHVITGRFEGNFSQIHENYFEFNKLITVFNSLPAPYTSSEEKKALLTQLASLGRHARVDHVLGAGDVRGLIRSEE